MVLKNLFSFFFITFIPFCALSQQEQRVLSGSIHVKGGGIYPYLLSFTVKGNAITGYSETKLANGSRPRAMIKGTFNKTKHTLSIRETPWPEKQKNPLSCFVTATLSYKKQGKNYLLSGSYKGGNAEDMPCGEGTIEFEIPDTAAIITQQAAEAKTNKQQLDVAVENDPGEFEITAGINKQFDWNSDSCILEMYDGGIVDGDEVSLVVNNKEILTDYPLKKQKKQIRLGLEKKTTTIDVVAGYEGKNPPNTVNIILQDGKRTYKIKAYNNAGEKAIITLIKK